MSRPPSHKFIYGLLALARAIEAEFKIICTRQTIQAWRKMEPGFPVASNGNRYDREECFGWVRDAMAAGRIGGGADLKQSQDALSSRERMLIRKDKREEQRWKKEQGEVIDRKQAELTIATAVRKLHLWFKSETERNLPQVRRDKLAALGLPPEQVAEFFEFDIKLAQEMVGNIETKCAEDVK